MSELRPRKKIREGKHFPRPITEKKHMKAPCDLITYLAGFRRFKGISAAIVGQALGVIDMTRKEVGQSPATLREAQIFANTIEVEVTVTIKCGEFVVQCPLFSEVNTPTEDR